MNTLAKCATLAGSVALAMTAHAASATSSSLDPATYLAAATDELGEGAVCSSSYSFDCTPSGPLSATASIIHLPDGVYSASAAATVSASPTPVILVSASIQALQLESGEGSPVNADAAGSLSYSFELTATPDSTYDGPAVPVLMNGFSSVLLLTGDEHNGTTSSVSLQITAPDGTVLYGLPDGNDTTFSQTLTLTPDVEYGVSMGASVDAYVSANELDDESETATATLDPIFTIDPACGCAGDFQLKFSPNVGDGAPIPEPATWATMLLGFGALGAAMRGRRAGAAAGSI